MITTDKVIKLFFLADIFCMLFDIMTARYTQKNTIKYSYHRGSTFSKAEIMPIIILYHDSGYHWLKQFYLECRLRPSGQTYNRYDMYPKILHSNEQFENKHNSVLKALGTVTKSIKTRK